MSAVIHARAPARRFYSMIAVAMALFAIVAFSRTYYLRFLSDMPPLRTMVNIHGAVFTAWLAVFVAQTRLIAARRVDWHRRLGIAAAFLAVMILLVGFASVTGGANRAFIHPSGLTASQFTIVGLASLAQFAIFISLGLAFRRRPEFHKRFMVLAMIAVLTPPSSRILTMVGLRDYWVYLVPVLPTLFIAWCLVHDWRKYRRVHPIYAIGGLVICLAWPFRLIAGRSEWYQPIGEWIAHLGTGT